MSDTVVPGEQQQPHADSQRPALSIIIVNWNGGALLRRCLETVGLFPPSVPYEVIVVDNASTDDSVAWLQSGAARRLLPGAALRILCNTENLGFSKANNQAIASTASPLLLLLNADTEVQAGALDALVTAIRSDPKIGACGPRMINPDGSVQANVWRNPQTPWEILINGFRLYRLIPRRIRGELLLKEHWDHASRRDVRFVSGAALLVKREVIDRVGPLDERFHFYYEDVEWCLRIVRAGWRILFEPNAVIMHHGQSSSNKRWPRAEIYAVAAEATVLGWELALPRWHVIANSLATCAILLTSLAVRRVAGRPAVEVKMMLRVHYRLLARCFSPRGKSLTYDA